MRSSLILGLALALGFTAGQVFSKDETNRPSEEMIKAHEKYGTPGAEHARFKALEGTYEARTKAYMDPSQPAKESIGKSEKRVVLGGLFLKEEFQGQCPFTGKSFEGIAYTGFDNTKKKYVCSWLDSLGSGIFVSEGVADSAGKVLTFNGTCTDPVTGADKKVRTVLTILDERKHKLEMFQTGPDGKELRCFEIDYTKK